jgi:FkbM family methyltransferase
MNRPAAQAILRGEVWEHPTLSYLVHASAGKTVIHAGTYFGDFLPALGAAASKVWAYEPNEENYRCAQATCSLNRLGNVQLFNAALGRASGQVRFQTQSEAGSALGGRSHVVDHDKAQPGVDSVPSIAIDEVVESKDDIAVIQLDVEGYETAALSGALKTIERCRPMLVLESKPDDQWWSQHLEPLGYQRTRALDDNTVFQCD